MTVNVGQVIAEGLGALDERLNLGLRHAEPLAVVTEVNLYSLNVLSRCHALILTVQTTGCKCCRIIHLVRSQVSHNAVEVDSDCRVTGHDDSHTGTAVTLLSGVTGHVSDLVRVTDCTHDLLGGETLGCHRGDEVPGEVDWSLVSVHNISLHDMPVLSSPILKIFQDHFPLGGSYRE